MPGTAVRTGVFAGRVRPSVPKLCVQSAHRYAFSYGVLTPVDHCGFLDLAPRLHRLPPARTPTAMLRQDLISTTHQPDPAPTGPPPEAGHLRWEDVLMEAREEATTQ